MAEGICGGPLTALGLRVKTELLELLRCPISGESLNIETQKNPPDDIEDGWLASGGGQYRYPIRNGIPRFVPQMNYADNFGMQWNYFSQTQLDSFSGQPISANRFWKATGWSSEELQGKWVLDVGCGSGRFAEIALNAGAKVVALDYSSAVDACHSNLKHHQNLHVVQGDIYALPFPPETFHFVYSLGVLQHTPDVHRAFRALPPIVRIGGSLCVDYYEKTWKSWLLPKYWLRPLTKRLPKPGLFAFLRTVVPILLPVSRAFGEIPIIGRILKRVVPVANYYGILPLNDEQQKEWALLDTFDYFSPAYDSPQTTTKARTWMEASGMKDIEILTVGHLVARGKK